jgi:hypothetical protein
MLALAVLFLLTGVIDSLRALDIDARHLERAFRLQASLSNLPDLSRWSTNFPSVHLPAEAEIAHAVRLLTEDYAGNCLYLVYQKEISLSDAEHVFALWRQACPVEVEIIPTLVLHAGRNSSAVFSPAEIKAFTTFLRKDLKVMRLGIAGSHQSEPMLDGLATEFKLVNMDLQLGQKPGTPFSAGLQDTCPALGDGQTPEEWEQKGLARIRSSAQSGDGLPRGFSLGATMSLRPGVSDPEKEAILQARRNALAAAEIVAAVPSQSFNGFSVDLVALQAASRAVSHDGSGYAFYEMLKRGHIYVGFYARSFHEIVGIYETLRAGKLPQKVP